MRTWYIARGNVEDILFTTIVIQKIFTYSDFRLIERNKRI